jgi:hypothetical protein
MELIRLMKKEKLSNKIL